MTQDRARQLLTLSGFCFEPDEIGGEPTRLVLNLNDTWSWASADCCEVPDDKVIEVAELFISYGWCGVLWWAKKQQGIKCSEFRDVNRFIAFVDREEKLKSEIPESSKRAYSMVRYTLGEE